MNKSTIIRLISSRFGDHRDAGGNEIRVCCPFCLLRGKTQDDKYKLYINPVKDAIHCFRCDYKGKASSLFPQLASLGVEFEKIGRKSENATLEAIPTGCYSLSQLPTSHLCREFLKGRRFGLLDFDMAGGLLFCEDYKKGDFSFGPRLLFPVYQFGAYRGFQARTIWKNTLPKYVNASGMEKKTILYNYDNAFKQNEDLFIVEGMFDASRTGLDRTVASFGKAISDEQIRLIALGDFKRVILLLDPDAKKEGEASARKLSTNFNTYTGILSEKDPAEMTREEIDLTELKRVF